MQDSHIYSCCFVFTQNTILTFPSLAGSKQIAGRFFHLLINRLSKCEGSKKCYVFQPAWGSKFQNGNAKVLYFKFTITSISRTSVIARLKIYIIYSAVKQKHLVDGFYINSAVNLKVQHPGRPQAATYRRFDFVTSPKCLGNSHYTHIHFIKHFTTKFSGRRFASWRRAMTPEKYWHPWVSFKLFIDWVIRYRLFVLPS